MKTKYVCDICYFKLTGWPKDQTPKSGDPCPWCQKGRLIKQEKTNKENHLTEKSE